MTATASSRRGRLGARPAGARRAPTLRSQARAVRCRRCPPPPPSIVPPTHPISYQRVRGRELLYAAAAPPLLPPPLPPPPPGRKAAPVRDARGAAGGRARSPSPVCFRGTSPAWVRGLGPTVPARGGTDSLDTSLQSARKSWVGQWADAPAAAAGDGAASERSSSAGASAPRPPPPSRTDRTRLVPPPVLIGHAASLLPCAAATRADRCRGAGSPGDRHSLLSAGAAASREVQQRCGELRREAGPPEPPCPSRRAARGWRRRRQTRHTTCPISTG